jgi:integrase/recombinase XerD
MRPIDILNEQPVRDFLEFQSRSFMREKMYYHLAKVLRTALDVSGCGTVAEFLQRARNDNNLHVVLQHVVNRLAEKYAPGSVMVYMSLLARFLEFHDVDVSRARKKVRMPKKGTVRVDRVPTLGEVQRLILGSKSARMRLLIQLLLQTGMRLNEALQLRVEHIDFDAKVIRLPGAITKTGKPREVPLIPELEDAIRNYMRQRKDGSPWLFPNEKDPSKPWTRAKAREGLHRLLKVLGLDSRDPSGKGYQIHFHVFRKWYKTMLERAGVNRLLIERWMGHETGVQGVYFLPTPEDEERERHKAAEALQIFGKTKELKARLDPLIEKAFAKQALLSLWTIEDELLRARALAIRNRMRDALAGIDQNLEVLRERMTEIASVLTREELEELERVYAGVSDEENEKNITSSDGKARVKRAALVGDGNPRSRRKNG